MDSGDRALTHLNLPTELIFLLEKYQNSRRMVSRTAAIRELIETHPAIAKLAAEVYASQ